jgi:hypothetical protein
MRPCTRMLLIASDLAFDETSNQQDGAPPWQDVNRHLPGWDAHTDNSINRKDS